MISNAFIMAFIGAAISMILGIFIYAEISESISETLPVVLVTIPATPEVEGSWWVREHCDHPLCNTTVLTQAPNYYAFEYRLNVLSSSFGGFDGILEMSGNGASPRLTDGNLGKVFDKDVLDGKLITWEVRGHKPNSVDPDLYFYDGELDPYVFSWQGTDTAPVSCGIDCFSDSAGITTSGSGGSIEVISPILLSGDVNTIFNFTGSADLSSFDSPTGKVTLVITMRDTHPATTSGSQNLQVTIEDLGTYRFKSDPANSWSGSTITCTDHCSGGDDREESVYTVTSLPPPAIPFISQETLDREAIFDRADGIAMTILAIIPITLFFGLFVLFGGRVES